MAVFYSHVEKALRAKATGPVADGRLQGDAPVTLAALGNPAVTRPTGAPYELFGPGDVERLAAGAITRRFPAPGASDAEEKKLALVEFGAPDLPWRYSPVQPDGGRLHPWLVLVVGRRAPDDVVLRPDGRVTLGGIAQERHRLSGSAQWAHVHEVDTQCIARVVSPRALLQNTEYVACVVAAFTAGGAQAWPDLPPGGGAGAIPVTVDCYDRWSFRTGPQGDFPDLASKLHRVTPQQILAATGRPFGRAAVAYDYRSAVIPWRVILATAGALRVAPDPGSPDPADTPPDVTVTVEVEALTRRIVTPDGRGVVTAPVYDAPFTPPPAVPAVPATPGGWVDQLRTDPRLRGAAGLGAWTAIEWQDKITDAAAARSGDLAIAHDRIRQVALGVEASRSLWRRRVPADPAGRLAVLAPALGRLTTPAGTSVLDEVSGRTPMFARALLSSAARRALRPGPARSGRAQPGAGRFRAVLTQAAGCPDEPRDPADLHRAGDQDPLAAVRAAVYDAAQQDDALTGQVLDHLGGQPSAGAVVAALTALVPGRDGRPDPDTLARFFQAQEYPDPDLSPRDWSGWVDELLPREPCRPVDIDRLSAAVAAAVDPTVATPPAARRVLATLPGITSLAPVEIEPELDLPLWSFLSPKSPDWLLPGAGDLELHGVIGVSTNPPFVHALLAGANHQSAAELRWRNVPMTSRWSPLRRFWQRADGSLDIAPIKGWPEASPLGSAPLRAPGVHDAEAVAVFRTPLFRRYPATVVYLFKARPGWAEPTEADLKDQASRVDPTFTGTIGDDITFFGFPVLPEALSDHWVVLEEPPAGYRFYAAPQVGPDGGLLADTGANFAYQRFALPVRVFIGPLL